MPGVRSATERWFPLPRGSIVKRRGKKGTSYFVVLRNRWHNVPDPQTKANAEIYRAQLVTEDARGEAVTVTPTLFADFIERWKTARYPEFMPNSKGVNDTCLKQYILPRFGKRRISSISTEDVQGWKADMLTRYAASTCATVFNRLHCYMRDAVRWNYIRKDPTEGVQRPRQTKKEMRFLTPAEVGRLLDAVPYHFWRTWFMVACTGGLRVSEMAVFGLR